MPLNLTGVHHGIRTNAVHREPWNKGKIVGQKAPSSSRTSGHFESASKSKAACANSLSSTSESDSKLRGCDLVSLRVQDICHGDQMATRAVVLQHKTQRPVQFEITPATREAVQKWIKQAGLKTDDFVFPSRIHDSPHLGTRQYARILEGWIEELGLDLQTTARTDASNQGDVDLPRTKNLRAVQLLLGHSKLESTVRYLGIEVDDALEISEQTEDLIKA